MGLHLFLTTRVGLCTVCKQWVRTSRNGFEKHKFLQSRPNVFELNCSNMSFLHYRRLKILIWWEHEHEDVDIATINHPTTLNALRECRLFKFWAIPSMRAQVGLLQWLVDRWNIQDQCFMIGSHPLEIELEDIYFLTSLPKRGE